MPLLATSPRQLALHLSDYEAGNPRQWYWLEIAALQPVSPATPAWPLWLVQRYGPALAWPVLRASALPGRALYALHARTLSRIAHQSAQDAALATATLPLLLAGFDLLTATLGFALWLLLLLGLVGQSLRVARQYRPPLVNVIPPDELEEELPGPEEIVGLQALLIATGTPPQHAARILSQLADQADAALPDLLSALPDLAPPPPERHARLQAACWAWLLVMLPPSLLWAWLPRWPGLLVCVGWSALVMAAWQRRSAALLVLLSGLIAFALGRLAHGL